MRSASIFFYLLLLLSAFITGCKTDTQAALEARQSGNFVAARQLYTAACDAAEMEGCASLAAMWKNGIGGRKDLQIARELYAEACGGKYKYACRELENLDRHYPGLVK